MLFQPSPTLKSRTYVGLIISQFLAAFNDQAIHASAMFYAIRQGALTEDQAISLMPILFYAPWAIFCTLAGYLADRFSKRDSLVFWKVAEIGITLVALSGFFLGSVSGSWLGPWVVLSTVFLMGMHSAFFVPAKYGCMPEILQPNLLSKGNGILESTSFLAVILGTVSGGVLSYLFQGTEYFIGGILVGLALLGAAASLLIRRMPAADPTRPFPRNPIKPLFDNLRTMIHSRPLALSVLGIAFFTFMVAFMRATVYMHGEVQIPRWTEFKTSLIVATVALGVGLGSYLAGQFSGGKVELGLVPLGAVGIILATVLAAFVFTRTPWLITALVLTGFFSGFYIVPLYTLLQHRAPKASKGDLIATSNFINVTGAICASLLFFVLVWGAHRSGVAPSAEEQQDKVAQGELKDLKRQSSHGRPIYFEVQPTSGPLVRFGKLEQPDEQDDDPIEPEMKRTETILVDEDQDLIEVSGGLQPARPGKAGSRVIVSKYKLRGHAHYKIRAADKPWKRAHDNEGLPRYLFLGASVMTLAILCLLCAKLPDFFVRALLWVRSLGRYRLKVIGMNNLPSSGPVILATNCDRFETCLQVLSATDRFTRFVLLENPGSKLPPVLGYLVRRASLAVLPHGGANEKAWDKALTRATRILERGEMVGLPADSNGAAPDLDRFLRQLHERKSAVVLPVFCGERPAPSGPREVQVVIGKPLPPGLPAELIRREIHRLEYWVEHVEQEAAADATTLMIPVASTASPTGPAAVPPAGPSPG